LLAGKHVLAEKPLCLTIAGAHRLHALAHERNRVLQVAYMKRHERPLEDLRHDLARIGEQRLIRHTVYHPTPEAQLTHAELLRGGVGDPAALVAASDYENVRTAEALGDVPPVWGRLYRRIVQGSLIHTVSLLRLVMGELPVVTEAELWPSSWLASNSSGHPSLAVRGRFGSTTRFEMNWLWLPEYPQYRETLEIHGTAGSVELELPPPYVRKREATLSVSTREGTTSRGGGTDSAFMRELRAFHAAIVGGDVGDEALGVAADTAWLQDVMRVLAARFGVGVGGEAGER
jgi:predicted dehydrogenase